MNTGNLNMLAEIVRNSDTYEQRWYRHRCGTPACIAGHACAAASMGGVLPEEGLLIYSAAVDWLAIDEETAASLFNAFPLMDREEKPEGLATNEEAAEVLRHLAETGNVDWHRARSALRELLPRGDRK